MNGGRRKKKKGGEKTDRSSYTPHFEPPKLPQVCSSAGRRINILFAQSSPGASQTNRITLPSQKSGQAAPPDILCFDNAVPGSLPDFYRTARGGENRIPSSVVLLAPAYTAAGSPNVWMPASSSGPPIPKRIRYTVAGLHPYWLAEHRRGKPKHGADLCFHGSARRE